MRFFRRHQAKIAIAFATLAVALLTAHRQITDEITKLVPGPTKEQPARPAPKGVDADSGNKTPSPGLPGPSPGGPPNETTTAPQTPQGPAQPPSNTSSPQLLPEVTKPVCALTGSLGLPVCH